MKQGWKSYLLYSNVGLFVGGLIYIIVETVRAKNTGFETKTLWDWMDLLIIPAVLAGGAILLNRSERALERKTAEDHAKLERDLATDRQQDVALQTYFDRMSELLLKEKLRTTKKGEVRDVARTRTLSIIRILDTKRIKIIIQFLREAQLITDNNSIFIKANMVEMNLQNIDLNGVKLQGANLQGANLNDVKLENANLQYANMLGVKMQYAYLLYADMKGAILTNGDMSNANFYRAKLNGAIFYSTNLRSVNLRKANLLRAKLAFSNMQSAELEEATLQSADLAYAKLQDASLEGANLKAADLSNANLSNVNLKSANLEGANLQDAKNTTEEQLAQAKSLKGATMPDGTKHK